MNYNSPARGESEFNYAVAFLTRLNNFFYDISLAKYDRDIDKWCIGLQIIFSELSTDMKQDIREDKLAVLKQISDDVNRMNKNYINNNGMQQVPRELWWRMMEMENWLRSVADDAGYQTRRKDDAAKALR